MDNNDDLQHGSQSPFWPILTLSRRIFAPSEVGIFLRWDCCKYGWIFREFDPCKNIFDFSFRKSLEL